MGNCFHFYLQVKQVLHQLQQVKTQIQFCQRSKPVKSGIGGFFSGLFEDSAHVVADLSPADVKKLHVFLDLSIKNLCFIYEVRLPYSSNESQNKLCYRNENI